jgi:hypothetical protein
VKWEAAWNHTRRQWMIWRDGSPAIAYCYVQADAEKIARLLNADGAR